jgi:hypothetical protein
VLVPIPVGPTLAAINAILLAQMDAPLDTKRDAAGHTIGERFIEEQRQCRRAPTPFAPEATTFATVSPRALVGLKRVVYSVWTRWVGLDLVVRIGATAVTLVGRDVLCATHPRKRFGERARRLVLLYRSYRSRPNTNGASSAAGRPLRRSLCCGPSHRVRTNQHFRRNPQS